METGDLLTAILTGPVIGALSRLVLPSRQPLPLWLAIPIGIVAALLGTLVAHPLGLTGTSGFDWTELAIQFAFAAVGVRLAALLHHRDA